MQLLQNDATVNRLAETKLVFEGQEQKKRGGGISCMCWGTSSQEVVTHFHPGGHFAAFCPVEMLPIGHLIMFYLP